MGQSPDDLRRTANGGLALASLAAFTQKDGKIYSELARALSGFLQDGGTLNLALKPDAPVSMKALEGITRGKKPDLKRIGFSSSVTKPKSE